MSPLLRCSILAIPCLLLVGGCVYDEPYAPDYYHHRSGYYRGGYDDRREVVYDRDRYYSNDRDYGHRDHDDRDRRKEYYSSNNNDRRRDEHRDDHRDDRKKEYGRDSNGPKLRAQIGGGWENQDSHGNKKDDKKKKKKHDDD